MKNGKLMTKTVNGRTFKVYYSNDSHPMSATTVWLTVHCDFSVQYNTKKGTFTERDTTR